MPATRAANKRQQAIERASIDGGIDMTEGHVVAEASTANASHVSDGFAIDPALEAMTIHQAVDTSSTEATENVNVNEAAESNDVEMATTDGAVNATEEGILQADGSGKKKRKIDETDAEPAADAGKKKKAPRKKIDHSGSKKLVPASEDEEWVKAGFLQGHRFHGINKRDTIKDILMKDQPHKPQKPMNVETKDAYVKGIQAYATVHDTARLGTTFWEQWGIDIGEKNLLTVCLASYKPLEPVPGFGQPADKVVLHEGVEYKHYPANNQLKYLRKVMSVHGDDSNKFMSILYRIMGQFVENNLDASDNNNLKYVTAKQLQVLFGIEPDKKAKKAKKEKNGAKDAGDADEDAGEVAGDADEDAAGEDEDKEVENEEVEDGEESDEDIAAAAEIDGEAMDIDEE